MDTIKRKYKLEGTVKIKVHTTVEATSADEARDLVDVRETKICRHGTSPEDAEENWVIDEVIEYPDIEEVNPTPEHGS